MTMSRRETTSSNNHWCKLHQSRTIINVMMISKMEYNPHKMRSQTKVTSTSRLTLRWSMLKLKMDMKTNSSQSWSNRSSSLMMTTWVSIWHNSWTVRKTKNQLWWPSVLPSMKGKSSSARQGSQGLFFKLPNERATRSFLTTDFLHRDRLSFNLIS